MTQQFSNATFGSLYDTYIPSPNAFRRNGSSGDKETCSHVENVRNVSSIIIFPFPDVTIWFRDATIHFELLKDQRTPACAAADDDTVIHGNEFTSSAKIVVKQTNESGR